MPNIVVALQTISITKIDHLSFVPMTTLSIKFCQLVPNGQYNILDSD